MTPKGWRLFGVTLALGVFLLIFWNRELVGYGFQQLKGQLRIVYHAKPINELLASGELDSITRSKLLYIQDVRRYAIDSLGLKDTDNYTTYFDQNEKPIMWVVTGSKHFELKEKTWWFPVINTVSYKGFFDEKSATIEAKEIEAEGFESEIYNPGGWSTLGYFTDPVLSNMLGRGPGKLAELIIHEMAHATMYLEGNVDLNENIATLAGEIGATRFLNHKFGINSVEATKYQMRLSDDEVYYKHMLNGYKRLDSLYSAFDNEVSLETKYEKKYLLISEILLDINDLELNNKDLYRFDFASGKLPGNPDFITYSKYRKDLDELKSVLDMKFNGRIGVMLMTVEKEGASALR